MPSLQNIDAFKKSLRAFGREPEIAAERGEALIDVKPPVGISQDDLSDLLDFSTEDPSAPETDESAALTESPAGIRTEPGADPEFDPAFPDIFESAGPELDSSSGADPEDDFSTPEGLFGDHEPEESSEQPGETDPFSFPEDFSFETTEPAEIFPEDAEPAESSDGFSPEDAGDGSSTSDEPPSPDELFASDFSSSFGEDMTGDLFEAHEKPVNTPIEPEEEDTTIEEGGGFDLSSLGELPGSGFDHAAELDDFSIPSDFDEEPSIEISSEPESEPGEDRNVDLGEPDHSVDDFGSGDFSIDEFNLGDLGKEYGIGDAGEDSETGSGDETLNPAASFDGLLRSATPEDEDREADINLTPGDFEALKKNLNRLPRNLKIIVEELIGEERIHGEPLRQLIAMLVHGESARNIASFAGKVTGKRIPIPKGYEKKSFEDLEAEQKSFSYTLKHTILPMMGIITAAALALALLYVIGDRLVYRPIYANHLYSRGYNHLTESRFQPAREDFSRAVDVQPMKGWFFKYADGYIERKQYLSAQKTYQDLLKFYPDDEKGLLAYADLESQKLADYKEAEKLLGRLLDRDMHHYKGLLAAGDNYLLWAEENQAKYEEARRSYAMLIQKYGSRDELLFRMLRYFIRTDKQEEVGKLRLHFQADRKKRIDPEAYAELAGYLITKNDIEDVKEILDRAKKADDLIPELHYNYARLFRKTRQPEEELKALRNSRELLERSSVLSRRMLKMLIDTHIRTGEVLYSRKEDLSAEQHYMKAIALYEDALARRLFQPSAEFGRAYAGLGDIFYYVSGSLPRAGELFLKAREHGFANPELSYKIGYVYYAAEKFDVALKEFQSASSGYFSNKNLLYSMATALYMRDDFFAAQAYYQDLLSILELEKNQIPRVELEKDPRQRALVRFLARVNNNLGVTLYQLGKRTGKAEKTSEAMVYFTTSSEYDDILARDPESLERLKRTPYGETAQDAGALKDREKDNLAFQIFLAYWNMRSIIYPLAGNEPRIYRGIPEDHTAEDF